MISRFFKKYRYIAITVLMVLALLVILTLILLNRSNAKASAIERAMRNHFPQFCMDQLRVTSVDFLGLQSDLYQVWCGGNNPPGPVLTLNATTCEILSSSLTWASAVDILSLGGTFPGCAATDS